jgi:hypothetical protein
LKKIITGTPSKKFEIIHEIFTRDNNLLAIDHICEIAGVTRGGYYKWLKSAEIRMKQEQSDRADFAIVEAAYRYKGFDKGVDGIHMRLLRLSPPIVMNHKKISRLMLKYGLKCPIRKANPHRRMAKAMKEAKVAPNLLNREFKAHGERAVLLTDITYIPRSGSKFSYLCVVMDAFTKEILAHVCSSDLRVAFVLETVEMLRENHGCELKTDSLIHSDQGFHYTNTKFIDIVNNLPLR